MTVKKHLGSVPDRTERIDHTPGPPSDRASGWWPGKGTPMTAAPSGRAPARAAVFLLAALVLFPAGRATTRAAVGDDGREPPAAQTRSSGVGEVDFDHEVHFSELEIPCEDCHHETSAGELVTPHPEYLDALSTGCLGCHRESQEISMPGRCDECHPRTPVEVADEVPSRKVVLHELCWRCHEGGRGEAASRSCAGCHRGESRNG